MKRSLSHVMPKQRSWGIVNNSQVPQLTPSEIHSGILDLNSIPLNSSLLQIFNSLLLCGKEANGKGEGARDEDDWRGRARK
ncbi:hypothetical protein RIF29_20583 [Crotalaria pallida]|uniref:Uncharacterized protein n=1 Tax=Crotalaria pallida TaxID=3830 RepID=A0AAN9F1E2_CROPI